MRLLLILGFCLMSSLQEIRAATTPIKVLVARSLASFHLGGQDLVKSVPLQNSRKVYRGGRKIRFQCQAPKTMRNKRLVAEISSPTGFLSFNQKRYRGRFLVHSSTEKGCDLIQEMKLEHYISALLAKEMRKDWPAEALKAQAVAARTYAVYHQQKALAKNRHWALENSERFQVHGHLFQEGPKTSIAANQTKGEILKGPQGDLAPIFYHSKCGGRTLVPKMVWKSSVDGYKRVECRFCHSHGPRPWEKTITIPAFFEVARKMLKVPLGAQWSTEGFILGIDRPDYSDIKFFVAGKISSIRKSDLRKVWGRKTLPSNRFSIQQSSGKLKIKGAGNGHGVGLCQYGAKQMAIEGRGYRSILAHYFPDFKIEKVY